MMYLRKDIFICAFKSVFKKEKKNENVHLYKYICVHIYFPFGFGTISIRVGCEGV